MKPRRSILSVPGHMEKMHHKALASNADVIMLDLEDSVPLDAKDAARARVIRALRSLEWKGRSVTVRINAVDTPFGYRDLLDIVENTGELIDAVVIPKVNHCGDIHFAERLLNAIELSHGGGNRIGIEAIIESAEGLENVAEIAKTGKRLKTLVFGVADYSASIGARLISISGHGEKEEDIYPGHRWHFALSRMIMAAKANGLLAIDAPYGNFKDQEGLRKSAVMACSIGCDGKWAIHPDQIGILNEVFSPSAEDIQRARRVIEAYQTAKAEGRGAVSVDGRMVDHATVRLAENLWARAQHLHPSKTDPTD